MSSVLIDLIDSRVDALLANDALTPDQQAEHDRLVSERERLTSRGAGRKSMPDSPPTYRWQGAQNQYSGRDVGSVGGKLYRQMFGSAHLGTDGWDSFESYLATIHAGVSDPRFRMAAL